MMIWKYLMKDPKENFMIPKNAQILSCQVQGKNPCIWALVDEKAEKEIRHFIFFGTGCEVNIPVEKLKFIDTIQMSNGEFVFHVFEIVEKT